MRSDRAKTLMVAKGEVAKAGHEQREQGLTVFLKGKVRSLGWIGYRYPPECLHVEAIMHRSIILARESIPETWSSRDVLGVFPCTGISG